MFRFFALFFACFTVKLGAFFFFRLLKHKNSPGFTVNVKIPEKGGHIIGFSVADECLHRSALSARRFSGSIRGCFSLF